VNVKSTARSCSQRFCCALLLLLALPDSAQAATDDARVEIRLIADLDEPRGYCLDIVGHQTRAQPDKGLHGHTCYSYQGHLATDQAFDHAALAQGILRLADWAVCVTVTAIDGLRRIALEPCDGRRAQRFDLTPAGEIVPRTAPGDCLGVHDTSGRPGGGGRPPHLIRALTVERCAEDRAHLQRWRIHGGNR
jgi:hypothetical protein